MDEFEKLTDGELEQVVGGNSATTYAEGDWVVMMNAFAVCPGISVHGHYVMKALGSNNYLIAEFTYDKGSHVVSGVSTQTVSSSRINCTIGPPAWAEQAMEYLKQHEKNAGL